MLGGLAGALVAFLATIGAQLLSSRQSDRQLAAQQVQFRQQLDESRRALDHQIEESNEALERQLLLLEAASRSDSQNHYWQRNFQVCEAVVESAARMVETRGEDDRALSEFDLLLAGKTAFIESFADSELRQAMNRFRSKRCSPTMPQSITCWNGLRGCIEFMACKCRAELCERVSPKTKEASRFGIKADGVPGCGDRTECDDLERQCE